jgi:colicin import membrane protein
MRVSFLSVVCVVGLMLGCTVPPLLPDTTILPNLNATTITSADKAKDAMSMVAVVRADIAYEARQTEISCYRVFYVNSCLSNVDVLRKRKEARLREIDLIAQQVIRNERTLEKNESIAKSQAERESNAPADALRREQAVEKMQDKEDSQTQKAAQLKERQAEDLKNQGQVEASRQARVASLSDKSKKAQTLQAAESEKRAKYFGKLKATKARQAKALEKQKVSAAKPPAPPRIPKIAKPPKAPNTPKTPN